MLMELVLNSLTGNDKFGFAQQLLAGMVGDNLG